MDPRLSDNSYHAKVGSFSFALIDPSLASLSRPAFGDSLTVVSLSPSVLLSVFVVLISWDSFCFASSRASFFSHSPALSFPLFRLVFFFLCSAW